MSAPDRRARLDMRHKTLSVRRQCALLGLARSGVYRTSPPAARTRRRRCAGSMRCTRTSLLRLAADRLRAEDEPQARAAADAADGHRGAGAEAPDEQACAGAQDFPVLLRELPSSGRIRCGRATYLRAPRRGLFLSGGDHGLGVAGRAVVAPVEHDGHVLLPGGARGGLGALRQGFDKLSRRSSTPTRAASSPATPSPEPSNGPASASRWTGAAASSTTSSSSGCGAR